MNEPILPSPEDLPSPEQDAPSPEEASSGPAEEAPWQCLCCGEHHLLRFEVCWKCGTPRDDTPFPQEWLDVVYSEDSRWPLAPRSFRNGAIAGIVVLAIGNVLMLAISRYTFPPSTVLRFLIMFWVGSIIAQGSLHSVWCVLAPVPFGKSLLTRICG